ncbi:YciI family protein [uncultured Dysosmobacter sp.]|uniref:YciI family protein n=1 Tax=uncultured Dysosmobacter sp. TaxID=2591384 RepID=UPI002617784B|nr:YciI family protein [uncultured Dysosmobacter sp.]
MYIFDLTYQKPLNEVDALLPAHIAYLDRHYQSGAFICSGRKNPRTGGVILCRAETPEAARAILEEDPFYCQGIADYKVTEFVPSKFAAGFACFAEA